MTSAGAHGDMDMGHAEQKPRGRRRLGNVAGRSILAGVVLGFAAFPRGAAFSSFMAPAMRPTQYRGVAARRRLDLAETLEDMVGREEEAMRETGMEELDMADMMDSEGELHFREPEPWEQPYSQAAPSGRKGKGGGRGAREEIDFRRLATYGDENDVDQRAPRGMQKDTEGDDGRDAKSRTWTSENHPPPKQAAAIQRGGRGGQRGSSVSIRESSQSDHDKSGDDWGPGFKVHS
ncbi:hypothetical protein T484DRAFT_1815350 [Baffinella frigidus]|nr:hypothetical protein T484DRAFT_1815350 [Cryptophyta sp. CCMP2293]